MESKVLRECLHEVDQNISPEVEIQGPHTPKPDSDSPSPFHTPYKMLNVPKSGQQVDSLNDQNLSSGGGSSDASLKDGSDASSPLSSDSEYETCHPINKFLSPSVDDHKMFEIPSIKEKLLLDEEEDVGSMLKAKGYKNYEELLEKIIQYEEENANLKKKLQLSEEEVDTLKCNLENKESLVWDLQERIESVLGEVSKKDTEINVEKAQALHMQNQINELVTQVSDSDNKTQILKSELEFHKDTNKGLEDEIIKLKEELETELSHQWKAQLESVWSDMSKLEENLYSERKLVVELQERSLINASDLSARDHEVNELKTHLQNEISSFSDQKRILEEKTMRCEAKITTLEEDHAEQGRFMELLNKDHDMLKLNYDTVTAEKDELTANVQSLMAEISSHNDLLREIKHHNYQVETNRMELAGRLHTSQLRVEELEGQLDQQTITILEIADGKKEAIRQLCFALEYYRGGYHELREAFSGRSGRVAGTVSS